MEHTRQAYTHSITNMPLSHLPGLSTIARIVQKVIYGL